MSQVQGQRVWDLVLVIAAGGALGGALRYLLNEALPASGFPWATFIENVTGCFLLGALMVYLLDVWSPNRYLRPFLAVGVLGGSRHSRRTRSKLGHSWARAVVLPHWRTSSAASWPGSRAPGWASPLPAL